MLYFGIISEVDAVKGMARVTFDGEDGVVSDWLPMSQAKAKGDQFMIPYNVDEHVWCIMDDQLENGVIGGAIYDATNPSSGGANNKISIRFVSGMSVEYDRGNNTLAVSGPGDFTVDVNGSVRVKGSTVLVEAATTVEIKATAQVKLTAPAIVCSGTLTAAAIATTGAGNITSAGNMSVAGNISVVGEVTANGIPFTTHKHTGVTTGAGMSGPPTS